VTLAIFDLDNTLLAGDRDHAWGEFLVDQKLVDEDTYRQANDHFYEQYKQGCLDIHEYLAFSLKPLTQHSNEKLFAWREQFLQESIKPIVLSQGIDLVQKHKDLGHTVIIITATNLFVTEKIAEMFDISHIIAPIPEIINDRYTGKVSGIPSYQDGKVTRLNAWMKESGHTLSGSYFYSDSRNDLPLLELVDHPVVVDGDDTLIQAATDNGWLSISLRQ
jgi:HAD superfamily hydrolase (TIGR01490 family)